MTENLQRVTAEIFAGNADKTKVGQFGSALIGSKVETTDVSEIQSLPAYTLGWSQAVLTSRNYPTYQEMNGVMKVMSYQTAYTMQKGMPEYDPNTTYYTGDMCKGIKTNIIYYSRTDNNLGNDPTTSPTFWGEFKGTVNIPATNYISEMSADITYGGNQINIPVMTLYAPNGRNADNTLINQIVTTSANTFEVTGQGKYTLFYNGEANNLLLSINYAKRTDKEPPIVFQNDVWYKTDNFMYYNATIFPNYTASDDVNVTEAGIVSNLGTLALDVAWNVGKTPTFNIDFTTGNDVFTTQSLFSLPFADAIIENLQLNVSLYGNSYTVSYYPTVYSGSYSLTNTKTTYSYTINGEDTIYSSQPITNGLTVYNDTDLTQNAGVVTQLSESEVTISVIQTVYDGEFSLSSSGNYYTYTFGDEGTFYTSAPLAQDVVVYTNTGLSEVYGTVASVSGSTVLVQTENTVYSGNFVQNQNISLYTYTFGGTTVYTNASLSNNLKVYSDEGLDDLYGVVKEVTVTNIIVQSAGTSTGYVGQGGSQFVAPDVTIYSDVDLKQNAGTSTGDNATYTGVYQRSKIGNLNYDVAAGTKYTGSLSYNGTSYSLNLNSTGTSLITTNEPYSYTITVTLGGSSAFLGSFDLTGVTIPSVWTWNNFNNPKPNWLKAPLVELGDITITNGRITELNINEPIELAKITDIKDLADKDLINTHRISDCVLSYIEPMSFQNSASSAEITLPTETRVLFADGRNTDNTVKSIPITTVEPLTLTIDKYSQSNNIIYLQYINKTLSLQYTDAAYYFEQDDEPEDATNTNIQYIWRSLAKNQWFTGNVNGWKQIYAVKVGEFTGSLENYITGLTVESPIRIDGGNFVKKTGDTMTGTLIITKNEFHSSNIILANPAIDWSTTTNATEWINMTFKDNIDEEYDIGHFSVGHLPDGGRQIHMNLANPTNNTQYQATLGVGYHPDGTTYTVSPTPIATSNGNEIATTKWVRTYGTANGGFTSFNKNTNGYIKFANGIIIQWGYAKFLKTGTKITLPTAYTNANYSIVFGGEGGSTAWVVGAMLTSGTRTNTTFTAHGWQEGSTVDKWCYWITIGY